MLQATLGSRERRGRKDKSISERENSNGFDNHAGSRSEDRNMSTILLIILILLLIGALPTWPYSTGWGYYPSGGVGLIVLILVILLLMGRL